ncbi:MAG: hypothetical protein PHR26_03425 [Candidatus ainarchaeum sp.]|nr:hypothetical protein [Candidatus ainarchaeum sp.]MDD3976028.1 hypothetical protein [Candidatus ainarchaeum sp.]
MVITKNSIVTKIIKETFSDIKSNINYNILKKHPIIGKFENNQKIKTRNYKLKILKFKDHIRIEDFERIKGMSINLDPSLRKLIYNIELIKKYAKKEKIPKIKISSWIFIKHPNFAQSLGFKPISKIKIIKFNKFLKDKNVKKIYSVYFEGNKLFLEYIDKSYNSDLSRIKGSDLKHIEIDYNLLPEYELII